MRIGITGGIGSGKSYVARLLTQHYGIPVYDSDSQARRLMTDDLALRNALIGLLGEGAYDPAGRINRQHVARYLFADSKNAARINAIVHPAVRADFLCWAERQTGHCAIESAILLEAGFRDMVNTLVVVTAPLDLRIRRACERDHSTEQQVRSRIDRQMPDAERQAAADLIIHNDGRPLLPQIEAIFSLLK